MAARQGGIPLGNALHLREEARDAWGWTWIDRAAQDLRYAARTLRKSPGFTVMAVLMLALGTGVNIAAFGFFDFMVLRPLNVRNPATLLRFHRRSPQAYSFVLPYPEIAFFREYSKTLSAVLALDYTNLAVDVAGLLLGVCFAAGLSRILRRVLYGISGLDPTAYLLAILLFALAAAVAAWLPPRRAIRLDPMRALRCD
jgi:hypothetical protein